MAVQKVFKRYEYKYLLTREQKELLQNVMEEYMIPDEYGKSTICNLYFDTPQYLLIRRSIENKVYKEKVRLRTYGRAEPAGEAFIELKKKYKKVVYKRRICTEYEKAIQYLCRGERVVGESQIGEELDYALRLYQGIRPAMWLSYEREAFYGKEDHDQRHDVRPLPGPCAESPGRRGGCHRGCGGPGEQKGHCHLGPGCGGPGFAGRRYRGGLHPCQLRNAGLMG